MDMATVEKLDKMPGTIFSQPWWLDAVAPGCWKAIRIERGGNLVARMPYLDLRSHGFRYSPMPPFTQTLGPWIRSEGSKYVTVLSNEKRLMEELVDQLPVFAYFAQHFNHEVTNWLPFYWKGYQQSTRYTYRLPSLEDLDSVWAGMRDNIRREIRKAQRQLAIRDDLPFDEAMRLFEMTLLRQGQGMHNDKRAALQRLHEACCLRSCCKSFFAVDSKDNLHAVAYIVWDENVAYYLIGGGNPAFRTSGAHSLTVWKSIQFAADVSKTYDFEGSMLPAVEKFFRAFGATQTPYFKVWRFSSFVLKAAKDIDSWCKHLYGNVSFRK